LRPSTNESGGRRRGAHLPFSLALAFPTVALAATAALGAGPAGLQPGTIDVALLQPTSGPFAAHNLILARGVSVAVQELNAAGGIDKKVKIRLVGRQLAANSNAIRTIASLGDKVRVLILPCNVDAASALAAAASKKGLLTLAPCNPDPRSTARLTRVWPVAMSGSDQVAQLVDYATNDKAKRAFILTSKPAPTYESALAGQFRTAARRAGMSIVGESAVALSGKPSSLASVLRKSSAQIVFTPIFSPQAEQLIAALRAAHVTTAIFGTDAMDAGLDLSHYSESALKDVYFASYGFPRTSSSSFFDAYRQQFHKLPVGSFPGLGLETVRTLAAAIAKAQSLDPARIDGAFAKGFQITGVALADRRYPGGGARQPIADVGIVEMIRNAYFPLVSSVPTPIKAR
jgi:branched-chain amino acid transport system substrate-binding protein